jgi:hypothetical protein
MQTIQANAYVRLGSGFHPAFKRFGSPPETAAVDDASNFCRDVTTPSAFPVLRRERFEWRRRLFRAIRILSRLKTICRPGNSIGEIRLTCVGFAYNFPQPVLLTWCGRLAISLQAALLASLHRL